MKKHFLSTLFLSGFLISNCLAQTNQGSVLLGGSIGFSNYSNVQKTDNQNFKSQSSNFSISPSAGYFITDQVAVGTNVSLSGSVYKSDSKVTGKSNGFSVAPFLRYYKLLGEKAALLGIATVYYSNSTTKSLNDQAEFVKAGKLINFGGAITPAFTYFVSSKIGLEASIGNFSFGKEINESLLNIPSPSENTNTRFQANFGLAFSSLGIYFYLNR